MGQIVAAMASSHAYTFTKPETWDERRNRTRGNYARRYGYEPPERPEVAQESFDDDVVRFRNIDAALESLRSHLRELRPDALILIGDDQDENYRTNNLPQLAIYTGSELTTFEHGSHYRCDADLARAILTTAVESEFDLASSESFGDAGLISHAHRDILRFHDPEGSLALVPVFVNAIHVPGPTPRRCYEFGRIIRQAVEQSPDEKRVAIYASGGMSHFTAGYPWPHYEGPATVGSICIDFDHELTTAMRDGQSARLAELSSSDLLANGGIEFRQWLVMLGVLGDAKPRELVYEPFFRAVMGMAVGYWDLAGAA